MMRTSLTLACAALTVASFATGAHATLLAYDSYLSGTNNANGEYPAGSSLNAANTTRVNTGFVNGAYASGTGSSNFIASSTSSTIVSPVATAGGRVFWSGFSPSDGFATRTVARNLTASYDFPSNGSSVFTSQVVTRGNNAAAAPLAGSFVGLGFANATTPTPGISYNGATNTAAALSGFYVGFAGTGNAADFGSLVIRARTAASPAGQNIDTVLINGATTSTENQTYFIVTKVTANVSGGMDALTYWVNPTDVSSESAMTASASLTNAATPLSFFGPQASAGQGDITRLTYAETQNTPFGTTATDGFQGTALFDEVRLGTTLLDVTPAPVPEPTALAALGGAVIVALRRRRK